MSSGRPGLPFEQIRALVNAFLSAHPLAGRQSRSPLGREDVGLVPAKDPEAGGFGSFRQVNSVFRNGRSTGLAPAKAGLRNSVSIAAPRVPAARLCHGVFGAPWHSAAPRFCAVRRRYCEADRFPAAPPVRPHLARRVCHPPTGETRRRYCPPARLCRACVAAHPACALLWLPVPIGSPPP